MTQTSLRMWTIYRPHAGDSYVAREWVVGPSGDPQRTPVVKVGCLENIRQSFRADGLVVLVRDKEDDPSIVETWL